MRATARHFLLATLAGLFALHWPAQAQSPPDLTSYLEARETKDKLLARAADAVREELPRIVAALPKKLDTVKLYVTEFDGDLPAIFYMYRTTSCTAVIHGLPTPAVICNARFLAEAEVVIRDFEYAGDLLTSDAAMLRYVRSRTGDANDLRDSVRRTPRPGPNTDQSDSHIGMHLKLALMFLVSHELGHLMDGIDLASFSELAPQGTGLGAVRNAVLKTCRHVDEFNENKFGLPGLEELIVANTDVRKFEANMRQEVALVQAANERRFGAEPRADAAAIDVLNGYLRRRETVSRARADEEQHLLIETLFVLGLTKWYKDLAVFADNTCGVLRTSEDLLTCMMQNRDRYVAASQVFGRDHRMILLRSNLTIRGIMGQRADYFRVANPHSIWPDPKRLQAGGQVARLESWRSADLQRFWLLSILMDTPVKFGYAACFTGWWLELDKKRGRPQLFVFTFEGLEMALERLKKLD